MIIIQLMGGLGNQLQQYAFYKKIESLGVDVRIDDLWFDEENQKKVLAPRKLELMELKGISYKRATKKDVDALIGSDDIWGKIRRHIFASSIRRFDENGRIFVASLMDGIINGTIKDLYIQGYFACEYYYADILERLRNEIDFPFELCGNSEEIYKIANDMKKQCSVSIHLRRGDYLDPENQMLFGGICSDAYYEHSIRYLITRIGNECKKDEEMYASSDLGRKPVFYIFSDDMSYAQEFSLKMRTLNPDLTFDVVETNKNNPNFMDIYLMSCCKHNVTANSTFSFWGARLNGYENKVVIRPTKHRNDQNFDFESMKVWWKGWIFTDPEGKIYD